MISEAFANPISSNINGVGSLIPFVLVFAIFYLLLIRPQQRKLKEHEDTIKNLKIGDKVLTGGGIIGKIVDTNTENSILTLQISKDVEIEVLSHTITSVVKKDIESNKSSNKMSKKKKKKKRQ
ncbi:preprotein translocase subunit YajC [Pseudomonadota bacterium]